MSRFLDIKIGADCCFKQVHQVIGSYAVFRKTRAGNGRVSYVIARWPLKAEIDAQPASVVKEFPDEKSAVAALDRWALDPLPPKAAPKPKKPGSARNNANRFRRSTKPGAGQMELGLE